MYKAIRINTPLVRSVALGCAAVSLMGCAALDSALNGDKSEYNWVAFLKDTDSNANNTVEPDEFTDYLTRQGGQSEDVPDSFSDMDQNGDEAIDEVEFTQRPSKKAKEANKVQSWSSFLSAADRNVDGSINSTEWASASRKHPNAPKQDQFSQYDIDGDGQVTEREYKIASEQST